MSENSQHIGYKKCQNDRIVVLEILGNHNENREDIVDERFAKMRCSKARVIRIYNMHDNSIEYKEAFGIRDTSFRYEINKVVEPVDEFDEDLNEVCASGIHYFLREEPAYYWEYKPENGPYESRHSNGQMWMRYTYKHGKKDGLYEEWHSNGQMRERFTYENGKKDGPYEKWYSNGQMMIRFTYTNGKGDGPCEGWNEDGSVDRCLWNHISDILRKF